jgi:hypothetical protein
VPAEAQPQLRARAQPTAAPGSPQHGQPPELGGPRLGIKGRDVPLPPDTFVGGGGFVDYLSPAPADADSSLVILRRGRSTIELGEQSGKIIREDLAPGEEGAFTFLTEALR